MKPIGRWPAWQFLFVTCGLVKRGPKHDDVEFVAVPRPPEAVGGVVQPTRFPPAANDEPRNGEAA